MDTLEIGSLRARCAAPEERLALRLRLGALLGTADVHPTGVPPAAVLIVRRMPDPLPGRVAPRGGFRAGAEWERAVRQALADLYRGAPRPARERVPEDAVAVCFEDEAEMLAALALDAAGGRLRGGWWWATVLARLPRGTADHPGRLLRARPELVPAVLHHLSARGVAATVLRTLSPPEAREVLDGALRAFDLPPFEPEEFSEPAGGRPPLSGEEEDARLAAPRPPPWRTHVRAGELPVELGREHACLLAVGLVLHRAPAAVAAPAFRRGLLAWWREAEREPAGAEPARARGEPGSVRPGVSAGESGVPASLAGAEPRAAPPARSEPEPAPAGWEPGRGAPSRTSPAPLLPPAEGAPGAVEAARPAGAQPPRPIARTGSRAGSRAEAATPSPDARESAGGAEPDGRGAGVSGEGPGPGWPPPAGDVGTRLGGVFYLVNVMIHLGLPDCFEERWRLGSGVGAWGVLEAIARGLLGASAGSHEDDSLWRTLAALDGRRPGEPPGAGFPGADAFRLPARWCEALEAPHAVQWATAGGRMRVWTGACVLLADEPREAGLPPAEQVRSVLRALAIAEASGLRRTAFAGAPPGRALLPAEPGEGLAGWTARALPYLRHRLCGALGVGPGDPGEPARTLLAHPARLYVTASHLDLVLPLEAVSLPVRRAGLDRDPGWLPRFGRVVHFHFR